MAVSRKKREQKDENEKKKVSVFIQFTIGFVLFEKFISFSVVQFNIQSLSGFFPFFLLILDPSSAHRKRIVCADRNKIAIKRT